MPRIMHRSALTINKASSRSSSIPKGYLAMYIGKTEKKQFAVPVTYLKEPSFQNLLSKAEEKHGFNHPMGGLTISCSEEIFINVTTS